MSAAGEEGEAGEAGEARAEIVTEPPVSEASEARTEVKREQCKLIRIN